MRKKVRSVASVRKIRNEMREELIVQQMMRQETENEEEELWHRKRVRLLSLLCKLKP